MCAGFTAKHLFDGGYTLSDCRNVYTDEDLAKSFPAQNLMTADPKFPLNVLIAAGKFSLVANFNTKQYSLQAIVATKQFLEKDLLEAGYTQVRPLQAQHIAPFSPTFSVL